MCFPQVDHRPGGAGGFPGVLGQQGMNSFALAPLQGWWQQVLVREPESWIAAPTTHAQAGNHKLPASLAGCWASESAASCSELFLPELC